MPSGAHSSAATRASCVSAAFDAEYAAAPRPGAATFFEATTTTRPPRRRARKQRVQLTQQPRVRVDVHVLRRAPALVAEIGQGLAGAEDARGENGDVDPAERLDGRAKRAAHRFGVGDVRDERELGRRLVEIDARDGGARRRKRLGAGASDSRRGSRHERHQAAERRRRSRRAQLRLLELPVLDLEEPLLR